MRASCAPALRALVALLLVTALAPTSLAQAPRERAVDGSIPLHYFPRAEDTELAALPDGTFWAVWSEVDPGIGRVPRGHRLTPDGSFLTDPFDPVPLSDRPETLLPRGVAADAAGTVVVLLDTPEGVVGEARARAFDPGGNPRGPSFPLFPDAATRAASLAARPGGDDLVAAGVAGDVYHVTRFAADGRVLQRHRQSSPTPNRTVTAREAKAVLPAGGGMILGIAEAFADGNGRLSVYRISPRGAVSTTVVRGPGLGRLDLAALADGRVAALSTLNDSLVLRLLSADLGVQGVYRLPVDLAEERGVDLAVDPFGQEAAVAWVDSGARNPRNENKARVRRFALDGTPLSGIFELSDDALIADPVPPREDDHDPHVAYSVSGVLGSVYWRGGDPDRTVSLAFFRALAALCGPDGLCAQEDDRFFLRVTWRDPRSGDTGVGTPVSLTDDTGAFWFFDPDNLELMVKVIDGRAVNGHFWVFYGSLTDVEFELTVADRRTGAVRAYRNPPFTFASSGDTTAFPETAPDGVSSTTKFGNRP